MANPSESDKRRAVEKTAREIHGAARGKITSEQAHREAAKVARRVERKKQGG